MSDLGPALRICLGLFACVAGAIVAAWWWLGAAVEMPQSPLAPGEKLYCISYAPFRADQSPLTAGTHIEPWQIDEDLARLKQITDCVRTYSIEHGLDRVPEIARRHGLTVLQGLWLSSHADKNRIQIDTTVGLAKRYPDVIRAIIVGNEVLLRGEMSAIDIGKTMREVKAAAGVPVTYADVWEFWLRNRDLASAADFVTVHILPYWEDFPIGARAAASHVDSIRRHVAAAFPDKEILIGEVGWPSAGRMREGALPSPSNQARVLHEVLAAAKRGNYRVNPIEAFDQPWKRRLEGTVGGHWGLYEPAASTPKFTWGAPVSDHPHWRWQAAGGVVLAALIFATALLAGRRSPQYVPTAAVWSWIAINATVAGVLAGLVVEKVPLESLGIGGWANSLALAGLAFAMPFAASAALIRSTPLPIFARVLGRAAERPVDPLARIVGILLVALTVLAVQRAFGLVFDPRYRDFPYAQLTMAVVPCLGLALMRASTKAPREVAETVAAAALVLAAVFIALNESFANWQGVWTALALLGLSVILWRTRDVQN